MRLRLSKTRLSPVYVRDRVWTADAIHTQKTACQWIEQFGGKYLFFFKDNHPTAHEDLALFFEDPDADQSTWGAFSQTEKGHGRLTTRTVPTTTEMNEWFASQWAGVGQTLQVIRTVKGKQRKLIEQAEPEKPTPPSKQRKSVKHGEQEEQAKPTKKAKHAKKAKQVKYVEESSQQIVYGFTNLTPAQAGPEAIATFLRDHWAIENRLHWRRDVTDAAKIIPRCVRLANRRCWLPSTMSSLLLWIGLWSPMLLSRCAFSTPSPSSLLPFSLGR